MEFRGFLFKEKRSSSRFYADGNNPVGRRNTVMPKRKRRVDRRDISSGLEGMAFGVEGTQVIYSHTREGITWAQVLGLRSRHKVGACGSSVLMLLFSYSLSRKVPFCFCFCFKRGRDRGGKREGQKERERES